MLRYIRSLREGNFQLYVECLTQIMPWMFALDHMHYSRWLPVHIRDMTTLTENHPDILAEFKSGNFVVHKASHRLLLLPMLGCQRNQNRPPLTHLRTCSEKSMEVPATLQASKIPMPLEIHAPYTCITTDFLTKKLVLHSVL